MTMKTGARMLAGIAVAGFFLYLFLMGTDTKHLVSVLRQSSQTDFGIALLLLLASHVVRVMRPVLDCVSSLTALPLR